MRKNDLRATALRFALGALGVLGASACVIVIPVGKPGRGDPFQPPNGTEAQLNRNATHRLRLDCGDRQVFKTTWTAPENVQVEFQAVNLSPYNQVASASTRLKWTGPGRNADVPVLVGDADERDVKGSFTLTGDPGTHSLELTMADAPDCGPVNFTISFR